jgi:hypothetical protein
MIVNVLIASPGDTHEMRDVVEQVIHGWNTDRARQCRLILLPLRWETGAVSELGGGAQAIINRQLVDDADIIIGLFDAKLGRPTPRFLSGTAEELDRGLKQGAKVHVYFSEMPLPRNVDITQLQALNSFRDDLQRKGLLGSFLSHDELARKIRTALERDTAQILASDVAQDQRPTPKAAFRVSYVNDVSGTAEDAANPTSGKIELQNVGAGLAENVRIDIVADSRGNSPIHRLDELQRDRMSPGSMGRFPVYPALGTASNWKVIVRWDENGYPFSENHTVDTR